MDPLCPIQQPARLWRHQEYYQRHCPTEMKRRAGPFTYFAKIESLPALLSHIQELNA
jgi:hypothetical protein